MGYKPNDYYAQKARKENFAARSIYKLEEIDKNTGYLKMDTTFLIWELPQVHGCNMHLPK